MEIFGTNKFSVNSIFFGLIDFKIYLVRHGLLLLFISFRLELVIGTCLSSISAILLEKFWKDLSTLVSEILRILSQFTFSKFATICFRTKMLNISIVEVFFWILCYCVIIIKTIKNCAWWSDIGEIRLPAIHSLFIILLKMLSINVWLRLVNLVGEVMLRRRLMEYMISRKWETFLFESHFR